MFQVNVRELREEASLRRRPLFPQFNINFVTAQPPRTGRDRPSHEVRYMDKKEPGRVRSRTKSNLSTVEEKANLDSAFAANRPMV